MVDPEARFEQLVRRLREGERRLTPQRVALLRLLAASEGHPSAAQLYDQIKAQFPTTSPGTVYKTLHLLKDLGEVLELGFSDDDNRYDGHNPRPHAHLICLRCRAILDPDLDVARHLAEAVARQSGYRIVGHRLDFYGLCPACQAREAAAAARGGSENAPAVPRQDRAGASASAPDVPRPHRAVASGAT